MKKLWLLLVCICAASLITACSSDEDDNSTLPEQISAKNTCEIPPNNENNAMAQLGIRIIRIGDEVRVIVPSDSVFLPRSGEVMESAYPGLNELAAYLEKNDESCMTVSAYTDDLDMAANARWLAEQQAHALITFLWTRGLCHQQFMPIAVGKAEDQTVASNEYIAGSAANRRVEITFRAKPDFWSQYFST